MVIILGDTVQGRPFAPKGGVVQVIGLLDVEPVECSLGVPCELSVPYLAAGTACMEGSEGFLFLQYFFRQETSCTVLTRNASTTALVLGILQTVTTASNQSNRNTGKPYSSRTGLYYEYQRWYDPGNGRFISQDPLPDYRHQPQSLNPYVYVVNQPTRLTDPSGADFLWQFCGGGERCGGAGGSYTPTVTVEDLPQIEVDTSTSVEVLSPTETASLTDTFQNLAVESIETPSAEPSVGSRGLANQDQDITNVQKFLGRLETDSSRRALTQEARLQKFSLPKYNCQPNAL